MGTELTKATRNGTGTGEERLVATTGGPDEAQGHLAAGQRMPRTWGQGPEARRRREAVKDSDCLPPRCHPDRPVPPPPRPQSPSPAPPARPHHRLWSRWSPAQRAWCLDSHFRKAARRAGRLAHFRSPRVVTEHVVTSLPVGALLRRRPPKLCERACVLCVRSRRIGVCVKQILSWWCLENGGVVGGVCDENVYRDAWISPVYFCTKNCERKIQ